MKTIPQALTIFIFIFIFIFIHIICLFDDVDKVLLKHPGTLLLQNPTKEN